MFDFADVTKQTDWILCLKIQFTFCDFCPLVIVIQEIHKKRIDLKTENKKH